MIAERLSDTLASGTPLLGGQTVILTGATGGIGRAIARTLRAAGARVALTDLRQEPLDALAAELHDGAPGAAGNGDGPALLTHAFDAADPAAFAAFAEEAAAQLGPVDGLVNCAGLFEKRDYDELDAAAWTRALTANLLTTAAGCQAVLPALVARGAGAIVNVASTAGEYGSISPAAHYAAAKGGVIALTKSLAREAAPAQVRVNAVSPGPIETDGLLAVTPEQKAIAGSRTLFGRLGQPEEIAGACVFLLSPLSTFVTGHVLRVNGGALL